MPATSPKPSNRNSLVTIGRRISHYKRVHVLIVSWRKNDKSLVENQRKLERAFRLYGFQVTVVYGDDPSTKATKSKYDPNKVAPTTEGIEKTCGVTAKFQSLSSDLDEDEHIDGSMDGTDALAVRENLFITCYLGHGGILKTRWSQDCEQLKGELWGISPDFDRIVPLSYFQQYAGDMVVGCDHLFMFETCDGDFDGTSIYHETMAKFEMYTTLEVLAAGVGQIHFGYGDEDYSRRLAKHMQDYPFVIDVTKRAEAIQQSWNWRAPGYYERRSSHADGKSIELRPLRGSPAHTLGTWCAEEKQVFGMCYRPGGDPEKLSQQINHLFDMINDKLTLTAKRSARPYVERRYTELVAYFDDFPDEWERLGGKKWARSTPLV